MTKTGGSTGKNLVDKDVWQAAHNPFARSRCPHLCAPLGEIAQHLGCRANGTRDAFGCSRVILVNVCENRVELRQGALREAQVYWPKRRHSAFICSGLANL